MESQRNQESMATDMIMETISFHETPYSPSHNKSDSDSGSSHDESHRRPEKTLLEQDFDQDEDFQDTFEHDHDYDEEFAQQTKSKKRCTSHKMEPAFSSPTPQYLSSTTPSCKSSSSKKKRVCEFCGRSDTPMWRRGPQGKGTLCNACGVKWSLKFRKRAGKKNKESSPSPKDYNDLPNYIEEEYKTPKKAKNTPSGGVSKSQKKSRPKSHTHYDMDDSVPSLNTIPFTSSLSSGVATSNSMPYRPPAQFQSKFHQDYEYSRESSPPLTPSVGSPLSGTVIEQDFIGGHPNHHSHSTDEESDHVKSTNNYGFSLNPYKASLGKGECNCKSCGISWTSTVFKTFQQFSDHCTNCAEKSQHHNEAQSKSYDDEYFLEKRFQRMRQVEANRRWDSDSSFDPSANRLLGHLLSVVKDNLLEEQELEEIKKELQHFRQEMRENEASRSFMLDQTQKNLQEDLSQFRTEITNNFTNQHSIVNNKIADAFELLRNETQSLSQNLKEIQRDISQSKVTESIMDISNSPDVTTSADQSILSKIKQLESHLFEMQYKMENTLGQVKSNQLQSIKNLEEKVTQQVEQRKSFVDPNFGNIKKQTNMYFNQLTNQFDQLDAAVNFRKQAV